jgi:DNA mismatch repair protein MutS2
MPDYIMGRARESMSSREQDVSRFLSELHARLRSVQELEKSLAEQRAALEARTNELAKEWERRESAKLKELERRCEAVLAGFESKARETIEKITETANQRKAADQANRRVARTRRELQEEFQTTVLATRDDARQGELRPPAIEEGARVRLRGIRDPARVRRKLGQDRIEVEAGFMKMQVPVEDVLEVLPAAEEKSRLPQNVTFRPAPELTPAFQEINVIGERAQEACERVEKFLDSAVMATASRVRVIHGHGMGVLKKAIWDILGKNPHVSRFFQAEQQEGGAGATIVELKD